MVIKYLNVYLHPNISKVIYDYHTISKESTRLKLKSILEDIKMSSMLSMIIRNLRKFRRRIVITMLNMYFDDN